MGHREEVSIDPTGFLWYENRRVDGLEDLSVRLI